MYISKKSSVILGLWENEVTVIKVLSSKEMAISDIAISTRIPRTSLYYILPKLAERGFIEKVKHNNKTLWRKMDDQDIYNIHKEAIESFNKEKDNETKIISKTAQVTLHHGNKNVVTVFDEISNMPPKSRFYGIQPEPSIVGAVERNSLDDIIRFNRKIKSKKIIVEGIIHEKGTDSMTQTLSKEEKIKFLDSFANRSADTAKLPENFLEKTKAEIYLYEDKVAIVNWYEEFSVIIKNKDVFELMKEMFNSTKYLLERYDQNEKIARRLIDFGKK
jgi:sugar-specific transcriptional regulator TrmB